MEFKLENYFGNMSEIIENYNYKKCLACETYPFKDHDGNSYDIWGKYYYSDFFIISIFISDVTFKIFIMQ